MKLNLFTKIAIVFALAGLLTNLISSLTITNAIESSFVEYHEDNQTSIIDLALQNFEQFNQENIRIIADYSTNIPLNTYLTTTRELSDQDLFKLVYDIEQSLDNSYNNVSHRNIFIKGINGQIYTDDTAVVLANSEQIDNSYITKASLEHPEKLIYTYGKSGFYNDTNSIVAVKQLPQAYSFNAIGTIYIDIEESTIKSLYDDYISESADTYIIDTNGNIISSNVKSDIGTQNTELLSIATDIATSAENIYFSPKTHEGQYKYFAAYIPVFDMYIVNKVDLNQALSNYYGASARARFSAILVVLAGIAIVFLITKSMSDPLNIVIKRIASTKKDNLKPIKAMSSAGVVKSPPEVLELVNAYNLMIDEIDGYTKELVDTEKQKRFAELSALQMQINPHFLYNTLAVIKYLVWQGEKEKAAKTIESLIDLLQNTISKNDEMINLSQEIENLKNYIYINEIRYGDRIKVNLYIDSSVDDEKVPKLIFQPFIENAYFHAFQIKKSGDIQFIASKKDNVLICDIIDNGDGMENFDENKPKEHFTGVGINNVDQRIKLIYGKDYGIKVTSVKGQGTKIQIKLPISKKNHNEN